MAVQPTTQQTYAESDLAPISELIDTSQKRGYWSKVAGNISSAVNFLGDATEFLIGTPVGRSRASVGI
jgi:hypothetical protein